MFTEQELRQIAGDAVFDAIPNIADAPGKPVQRPLGPGHPDKGPPRKSAQARLWRRPPRREKVFGHRPIPLDRNAKARIKVLMHALTRRTEPGKAYGKLTAKAYAVGIALLFVFHNAASGLCFPSYEAIAEAAGCSRSTVAEAIKMLESAGVLTWANRVERVRETTPDRNLFGRPVQRWRVVRTSNSYRFTDPQASKSDFQSGTTNQFLTLAPADPAPGATVPASQNCKPEKRLGADRR
jgi:hypothetical protein